jgi:ATP-dependent DNA ligase
MQKMAASRRFIAPMECLPVDNIPDGKEWQYELKLDGYRAFAVKDSGEVSLYSRNGNLFNTKFPAIAEAFPELRPKRFVIDGDFPRYAREAADLHLIACKMLSWHLATLSVK